MMLSTGQRFADERNTHRVLLERALDHEHAVNLLELLVLTADDIERRYAIGARIDSSTDGLTVLTFVDGSRAAHDHRTGRWTASRSA